MNYRLARQLCVAVAMLGVPSLAMAQGQVSPADVGNRALSQTPILTSAQLGDLVAPIALYPDALLSQVLVASTYPLEVVQAQQWLRRNEGLRGEALMDAARQQPWDASVQGLVAFPDALATLNEDVQWTTALGNAFLAQESDVMAAVQRLRTQAQARGRLSSNPQQTVSAVAQEGRTVIEIVPADPQVIYVPQYDPYYVWGSPAWGAYPPLSYGYGYGYGAGINVGFWFGGWSWGLGWGWGPNWYGGSVYVSDAFFRHCGYHYGHHGGHGGHNGGHNGGHGGGHDGGYDGGHNGGRNGGNNGGNQAGGHAGRETWQHDAGHRMGVPYTNSRIAGRYDAASQASRSTMTGLRSSSRAGGMATSTSSGTRALYQGSRGSGTDQAWRSGTRAEVSGSRGGGTDQGWRAGSRTEALGSRGGAADQSWRGGTRAEASGSRGGLAEQSWRGGTRTEASGSRGGGADRGWSSSGDQGRRSESAPQSRSLSSRYSAPSPRYSASSPRSSAPSSSYSAPSRSFSSSAPTRGFQSAPRSYSSSGGGRSYGSGSPQSSGGGGGSRGAGGGHGSGGGSRGGGHRR